jgi:hypothetical protein
LGERATGDNLGSDVASGPSSVRQGEGAGKRSGDVVGNIGEMPWQRGVNGRVLGSFRNSRLATLPQQRYGCGILAFYRALEGYSASRIL